MIRPRFTISRTWEGFPIIRSTFSILSINCTHSHNDSGSEQIDPLLTLYKRIKSHLTKVSSVIHYFLSLCFKQKTDLTIRGSLAGSHWSPLTILSFSSGHQVITVARSISTYWFSCIIISQSSLNFKLVSTKRFFVSCRKTKLIEEITKLCPWGGGGGSLWCLSQN